MCISQAHTLANFGDPKNACVCLDEPQYLFRQKKNSNNCSSQYTRINVEPKKEKIM